ncbi:lysocardiolipin acyltransferase 1 [Brachionus plicatilis]|uniref:Lysocardiolipin acyltransferase 1 n=1 Tax=Brachionus plicatilis TaxID=10195 RepID=A0A3M7P110_BRAPC|nr:lysocardiolipin acyltransferase 1 [Brachionus plicatilis]
MAIKGVKLKYLLVILMLYVTSTIGTLYMLFPYTILLFFNRKLFHKLCDFSLRIWFGFAVYLLEEFCNIKIFMHVSKINNYESRKSSIVVMNHRTRLDWLFYFCILYRLKALSQIKIILKDSLKRIPGPAWAMQTALFIFIKRKWTEDQNIFNKFIDYYNKIEKKFMILIFPEGTNMSRDSIEKSNKFADEKNLPRYEYVIHPRVTGFNYIFNRMYANEQIDCIHDVTVGYRGGKMPERETDFLAGNMPNEIHFFIDKFSCEKIFEDKNEKTNGEILEEWICDRWQKKEEFLKKFYQQEQIGQNYETKDDLVNKFYLTMYPIFWLLIEELDPSSSK